MIARLSFVGSLVLVVGCNEAALDLPPHADGGEPDAALFASLGVGPGDGESPKPPIPAAPANAEGTVTRIQRVEDVPLAGYRVDAHVGDYLLKHAGLVAVVSAERGRLVDFGLEGGEDGIHLVEPVAFDALERMHTEVARIAIADGGHALRVEKRVLDKPLALHAYYFFEGGALRVETTAVATTEKPIVAITLGEVVSFGNTPTWVEGHGFIAKAGSYSGTFFAAEPRGTGYALCSAGGRLVGRFDAQEAPGFHENARTGEVTMPVPAFGMSATRSIAITVAKGSLGEAVVKLPCGTERAVVPLAMPASAPPRASVEVARCKEDDGVGDWYTRFDAEAATPALPEGCFKARVAAPGHAPGAWVEAASVASDTTAQPTAGTLRWHVTEKGDPAPLPSKITLRGIGGTRSPSFGEDRDDEPAVNSIYTVGQGETHVPPGRYRAFVWRGFEYTLVDKEITIAQDQATELDAVLERVVDTRGFVSADLHVHAIPSADAPTPLESRVRSLAAVGVEVAVATDHNAVTDYAPTIERLGYKKRIASVVGDEVTTRDVAWGHFNAFPLRSGVAPVAFASVTPAELFASARASAAQGAPSIVQVNHPRMGGIGYFELLHLDDRDVKGWLARAPLADMDFDAIEVFNGDHYDSLRKVENVMRDWYALLEAGFRETATGNSDSHKAGYQEAGVPRNYVAMPSDDPSAFDERAFVESIKAHRVIVSSGPFVRLEANGSGVGSTVQAGKVAVTIHVEAAPWIDVSQVELVKRGKVAETWKVAPSKNVVRLDKKLDLDLVHGDWFVVVVRGKKSMPVMYRSGALPFAFTNPIWVE